MNRFFFLFTLLSFVSFSQHDIDVHHYAIHISLNDSNDVITVTENITFQSSASDVVFDLQNLNNDKKGMVVESIIDSGKEINFTHAGDSLTFNNSARDKIQTVIIQYSGIPENGLIISKNRYGKRTFFGDNWPNRAHQWFVCNDHPSDKSTVKFSISAPKHYQAVANGVLQKIDSTSSSLTYHFSCSHKIPTKVMVIGVADFNSIQIQESPVPIYNYVYADNPFDAFVDLELSNESLTYFTSKFGPYPFTQLFNVQSTTIFGGMENAGCIFYDENSFTGDARIETLIAHEIAHQWFGNSASEINFNHLWLSEGFATYLTHLFMEHKYGTSIIEKRLIADRKRIIAYQQKEARNVVTNDEYPLMSLLNPNAYQKGSFILHMLRNEIGDSLFFSSLKEYHSTYQYGNASTPDFFAIIEKNTQKDFSLFQEQWLYTNEIPQLTVHKTSTKIQIHQRQKYLFDFDLEIEITYKGGEKEIVTIPVKDSETHFSTTKKIDSIRIDPHVKLLFDYLKE